MNLIGIQNKVISTIMKELGMFRHVWQRSCFIYIGHTFYS